MKFVKKIKLFTFLTIFVSLSAHAVIGQLDSEELTPSGKVCYYDLGNGVIRSITVGISESCPQTHNF